MTFMVAGHFFEYRAALPATGPSLPGPFARRLARLQAGLVAVVAVLAVTTTQVLYRVPAQRALIDQRILNGYEKFARRYAELGLWGRAADFFARTWEGQPQRIDLLEELVSTLETAGDEQRYRRYARELLERTLTPAQMASRNPTEQLSVATSYREIGDLVQARRHVELALTTALQQVGRSAR